MINLLGKTNAQEVSYSVNDIPDSLKANANAVIRLKQESQTVSTTYQYDYKLQLVVTILNSDGEDWSKRTFSYDQFDKISKLSATIYDLNGKKVKSIRTKDIKDYSHWDGFSVANDNRYKYIKVDYADYPYTIIYDYEKSSEGFLNLRSWYPIINSRTSVQKSSFDIRVPFLPEGEYFRHKVMNFEKEPIFKVSKGNLSTRYFWEVENQKAIKSFEKFYPVGEQVPKVDIATNYFSYDQNKGRFNTWNDFASWNSKLLEGRDVLSPEIKEKVNELTKDLNSEKEKIRVLYEWLQKNTRYVSVQLGIGGFQPFLANDVVNWGYGDCKALTNLLKAMLNHAGITSYYTIINAGRNKKELNPDFPKISFNHAFLCVPNPQDTIWLECTSQTNPFGYLGTFTSDRWALMLKGENGELVKTKKYTKEENKSNLLVEFNLDKDGNAKVKAKIKLLGIQSDYLQNMNLLSDIEQKEKIHNFIDLDNFDILNTEYDYQKNSIPEVNLKLDLAVKSVASVSGKRYFLPLNKFYTIYNKAKNVVKDRKFDVIENFAYQYQDTLKYRYPKELVIEKIPKNLNIKNEFGEFYSEISQRGNSITYVRNLIIYKNRISPDKLENWKSFWKKVSKFDRKRIVLKRN